MTSRHSSASSCCESGVEPTRSQKRTVRWRRSPAVAGTGAAPVSSGGAASGGAPDSARDAPHWPQKSDAGGLSVLHFTQDLASTLPHFAQKLLPDGLLVRHFEQRISRPWGAAGRPFNDAAVLRDRLFSATRNRLINFGAIVGVRGAPHLIRGFDSQLDSHGLGYARMKPKELDTPMYENIRDGGGRTPFRRT